MSLTDADSSKNGWVLRAWSPSWTHVRIDRRSPGYCRVTFDHPPINTITATTVAELAELIGLIEQDADLNVVVFDSANPDSYLADYDAGPTGLAAWEDFLVRLARAPMVSIAAVRGRACGAGGDFVLACDLRFAAPENTEIDIGVCPAGGLPRLLGRGRALEILLLADDPDGLRTEQYVNRLVPDRDLDTEVEAIATRLARCDHDNIARTKSYVDHVISRAETDIPPPMNGSPGAA